MVELGAAGEALSVTSDVPDETTSERPAFDDIYRTHAARVFRYCLSQVSNRADAEDLAADVFASAYRAYPGADLTAATVLAWLLRIARNAVIDHRRRHTRRAALLSRFFGAESEADASVNVEGEIVFRDEVARTLAAMVHLSERDRTVIGLRIAAGLPYAEVGAVLGISEHAAIMAGKRAIARLRRHLEPAS